MRFSAFPSTSLFLASYSPSLLLFVFGDVADIVCFCFGLFWNPYLWFCWWHSLFSDSPPFIKLCDLIWRNIYVLRIKLVSSLLFNSFIQLKDIAVILKVCASSISGTEPKSLQNYLLTFKIHFLHNKRVTELDLQWVLSASVH